MTVPILSDDHAYTLGYEAGMLHSVMCQGRNSVDVTGHVENEEQFLLIAGWLGYQLINTDPFDEGWIWMEFARNNGRNYLD